jgi:hypothetical protein
MLKTLKKLPSQILPQPFPSHLNYAPDLQTLTLSIGGLRGSFTSWLASVAG